MPGSTGPPRPGIRRGAAASRVGGLPCARLRVSQVAHDGLDLLLREPSRLHLAPGEAPDAMPCPPEGRSDAPAHIPGRTRDEHWHWEAPVAGCLYNFNGAGPRARVTLDPQGAPHGRKTTENEARFRPRAPG